MTPEEAAQRQADCDGIHAALSIVSAYLDRDLTTIKAVMQPYATNGTPVLMGLLATFDSLLRSVPGEPKEILEILRGVAFRTEAGDFR